MSDPLTPISTAAAKASKELSSPIVNKYILPKIDILTKKYRVSKKLYKHFFQNQFQDYLERTYEKHFFINTIVFRNQKVGFVYFLCSFNT